MVHQIRTAAAKLQLNLCGKPLIPIPPDWLAKMLSRQIIDQLQPCDFDRLARKERDGRCRLRPIALAHLKDGKSYPEVAPHCA